MKYSNLSNMKIDYKTELLLNYNVKKTIEKKVKSNKDSFTGKSF